MMYKFNLQEVLKKKPFYYPAPRSLSVLLGFRFDEVNISESSSILVWLFL